MSHCALQNDNVATGIKHSGSESSTKIVRPEIIDFGHNASAFEDPIDGCRIHFFEDKSFYAQLARFHAREKHAESVSPNVEPIVNDSAKIIRKKNDAFLITLSYETKRTDLRIPVVVSQCDDFSTSESTTHHNGQHRLIASSLLCAVVADVQQALALTKIQTETDGQTGVVKGFQIVDS